VRLTVDSHAVFASTGGRPFDPALPAVLFLHGAGLDHSVWALQTRYFAHRGRAVLAPDLPGHGRTGGPALPTIGDIAEWVGRLMDGVGIARAALVGHSMGALAALEAAARLGDRVSALALLGVAETMPVHPDLIAAAAAGEHLAFELITDWAHGPRAHLGGYPAPGLWQLGGDLRLLERGAYETLATDLVACNLYKGAAEAAANVICPGLLVLGANDRMTPAAKGLDLAGRLSNARVVTLPGAGHMMMLEQPGPTLDALKDFLLLGNQK
jgi:pimeloyl-ACP methyl ester carboxylesterase